MDEKGFIQKRSREIIIISIIIIFILLAIPANSQAYLPSPPRPEKSTGIIKDMWLEDGICHFKIKLSDGESIEVKVYFLEDIHFQYYYERDIQENEYNLNWDTYWDPIQSVNIYTEDGEFITIDPDTSDSSNGWKIGDEIEGVVWYYYDGNSLVTNIEGNDNHAYDFSRAEMISLILSSIIWVIASVWLFRNKREYCDWPMIVLIMAGMFVYIAFITFLLPSRDTYIGILSGIIAYFLISYRLYLRDEKVGLAYAVILLLFIGLGTTMMIGPVDDFCCLPSFFLLLIGLIAIIVSYFKSKI